MYVKQINTQHSKLATINLKQLMIQGINNVYLVQEPYKYKNRFVDIPIGFKTYGTDKSRAIIIAHKDMELIFSNELSTDDVTVCYMNNTNRYFASIYLDIHKETVDNFLTKIADFFTATKANAILGIDSNAHSVLWGEDETNPRGEALEEFIMSYNITLLNKGKTPTFVTSRSSSIIDISLVFGNSADIDSWEVITEHQFSDHRMISFRVGQYKPKQKLLPKTDWVHFQNTIHTNFVHYSTWDNSTIEIESRRIENIILSNINNSTRMIPAKSFIDSWWNNELQKQKMEVKRLAILKLRHPTANNISVYNSAKKSFTRNIRKAKRSNWREFCENIESPKNMAKLNKIVNRNRHVEIGLLKSSDGTYARTVKETIDILMKTHLPGSVPLIDKNNKSVEDLICSSPGHKIIYDMSFDSFINEDKVKLAFSTFNPDKSPGEEGIRPKALQLLDQSTIRCITNLYKACIEIGYTPERWRGSKLIFIPKPNKKAYDNAKAFRPINLMSFFMKGLEKLILWEIEETALKNFPLSKNQHAFRKGYSTDTAISSLIDEIESSILRGEVVLSVFLDLESAFDSIQFSSVIDAMQKRGISQKIIEWYKQYINNRYAKTSILGETKIRQPCQGVQQGAILSPLAFNLVFDELLSLHKGPVKVKGYADDGVLIIKGKDPTCMVEIMQSAINKTLAWGKQHGLRFHPQKTVAMFFHRKYRWKNPKILLAMSKEEEDKIEYSTTHKYLGINLDSKLSFNKHVENKIINAKKHLMMIKNAIGSIWGPSPRIIRWSFNAIILPSLLYGSVVWARTCSTKTVKDKLSKLNRLIACCMLPLRKSTPTEGLEVILDLPPLDLKVQEAAYKTMLRVLPHKLTQWVSLEPKKVGHLQWGATELKKLGIDPLNNDSFHTSINISRRFNIDPDSFKSGLPITDSENICYTDGSRMQDNSGYGFGITKNDFIIAEENGQLDKNNSVFQAEVYAIHKACKLLKGMGTKNVTIFSDSQSALSALAGVKIKSKVVKNCIDSLNELGNTSEVKLKWVKAHSDHTGNEFADMAAKSGTVNLDNKVDLPLPKSFAVRKITEAIYGAWNQRWSSNDPKTYWKTRIWFPVTNKKKSKSLMYLNRQDLGNMVQMISGHDRLNRHESKSNTNISPNCRFCNWDNETFWHLIGDCQCPILLEPRKAIFQAYYLEENPEWKPHQLLKFIQKSKLSVLNDKKQTS